MNLKNVQNNKKSFQEVLLKTKRDKQFYEVSYLLSPFILNERDYEYPRGKDKDVILPSRENITSIVEFIQFINGFVINLSNPNLKCGETIDKMLKMINTLDYDSENQLEQDLIEWCGNMLTSYRDDIKRLKRNNTSILRFVPLEYEKKITKIFYTDTYPDNAIRLELFSMSSVLLYLTNYIENKTSIDPKKNQLADMSMQYILNQIITIMPYSICMWYIHHEDVVLSSIDVIIKNNLMMNHSENISAELIFFILSLIYHYNKDELSLNTEFISAY